MVNIFKKSCPLFLLFITACGKNFAIDDLGLTLASLKLNPQLTNKMLVTLSGTCDPTRGIVTITPDVDPVTHIDYFAPASLKVDCKSPGTFSADVTLSSGDGLKSALIVQEKDTALGAVRLDMTSPDRPVVTSPVNGEKITTKNLTQNLVPKISGTGEVDATVKVTSLSSSCTTTVDASGKWSCFLEPLLPNGVHMMNVSQVDLAGNTSAVTSLLVEIISNGGVTPSAPTILNPVGGIFLKDINQTLTGQCDSTASVVNVTGSIVDDSLFGLVGNKSIVKTTCSGAGTYSVSLKLVAGDGVKNISVSQIVNGSASYPTTATYILDTILPAAPVISSPLAGTNVIDTTPVVRGTGLAGSFVKVKAGVNLSSKADATCEATVAASGNWFCELYPAITPPSVIDIEVTQEDLASNPSIAAKSLGVKVDPTLLASPTIITPAFGSFLSTLTAAVSGTCTDGNTVTFIGNITPAVSVVCAGGTYTANVTFVAGEGSKMLQATQTDSNGVVSLPSVVHYMFDNVPPSIPVVTSPTEGVFVNNNQTTISGTGVVSSIVTVTATGGTPSKTSTCQATVNNSNKWSCSLSDVLNDGAVTVSAVQADSAGNVSASSSNVSFTIDTSIPSSPTVDDPTSGISLNLAAQKIKGTCTNGLIVELRGNIIGSPVTGTCAANQFEINVQLSQENKLNTIAALQRNQAGTASPSVSVSYKWDTLAPEAPVISSPPQSTPPNRTTISDKTPTVSGIGEAGATIYVSAAAPSDSSCSVVVNPNGTWSCDLGTELVNGDHTLTALQKDLAGNESLQASVDIIVDPNAGAAPAIQDPASGTTLASAAQNISISCIKDMTVKLTGNISNSPVTKTCSSSSSPEIIQVNFTSTDGAKSLQATQVDLTGTESPPSVALYVLDTSAPSGAPTITSPQASSYLLTATPSVWGTGDAGAKIKVKKADGTLVCSVSADSSGSWFCPATQSLGKGSVILSATQTDSANHESDPTSVSVVVDLDNPTGLTIATPVDKATLINLKQTISGACEAAANISLTGSFAESPLNATCSVGGAYSEVLTLYPGDGLRSIQAIQMDPSGRTQGPVKRYFYVDTNSPLAPMIASPLNNSFTSNTQPSVLGIGEVGATVTVTDGVGGSSLCVATVNSSGNWSCTSSSLAEGAHTLVATQTDVASNPASGASNQVVLNVDTTSPDAPVIEHPVDLAYVGARSQILEGTCEEGAIVSVSGTGINPRPVLATCANAKFEIHVMLTATDGDKTVTISQKDAAGNSTAGSDKTYKLKTSSSGEPTITGPVDGSILNAIAQDIEGACSEGATVKLYGQFTVGSSTEVKSPLTQLCPNTNTYKFSVKFTSVNGSKNIYVSQTDPAGNTSNLIGATYILDTVNPSVSINSLVNISSSNKASYLLSGTCSENAKTVSVSVDDTDGSTAAITATPNCSAHVWSVTKDLSSLIDGTITVTVSQVDAATNSSGDVTTTTTKDNTPPVVTVSVSDIVSSNKNAFNFAGTCVSSDGQVSGTLTDGSNIVSYTASCVSDAWSVSGLNVSNLKDGTITVSYVQTDSSGNQNSSHTSSITKDTVGPIVALDVLGVIKGSNKVAYTVSGTCEGTDKVSGSLSDGKTSVAFSGVSCGSSAWTNNVDVSALRDGMVSVNASQTDAAGNVGNATAQTVVKDVVAPVLAIGSLDKISASNKGSYVVSGTCSVGDGAVSGSLSDGTDEVTFSGAACSAAGEWTKSSLDVSSLADGNITVAASQTDAVGNVGSATAKTVVKDAGVATLSITTTSTVNKSNYASFDVTGTCSETGKDVVVSAGSGTTLKYGDATVKCLAGAWIANLNFTGTSSSNTSVSINVNHSDDAGNAAVEGTKTFTFDIVDPVVALDVLGVIKGSNKGAYTVSGTCEGTDKVSGSLSDGKTSVAFSGVSCGSSAWTNNVDVSALRDGMVSVNASQTDAAGNVGNATAQTVVKDVVAPVLAIGSLDKISASNKGSYVVSGTCSVGDGAVSGSLSDGTDEVTFSGAACSAAGEWTKSSLDVSSLADGNITVAASQTDAVGNVGSATVKTVVKDAATSSNFLDNSDLSIGFGGGTKSNVTWDIGNNYLKLSSGKSSGVFTSRVMDYKSTHDWVGLEWKTTLPFGKELTTTSEVSTDYSGIQADLMKNVLAIWHMNDAVDASVVKESVVVNTHDLSLNGDVALEGSGKFSTSTRFNNGYLILSDTSNNFVPIDLGVGFQQVDGVSYDAFTVQAWVMPDYASTVSGSNKIIFENKFSTGTSYSLSLVDGKVVFRVYDSANNPVEIMSDAKLPYGKWAHVVVSVDVDLLKLYVNNSSKLEPFSPLVGPARTIQYDSESGGMLYIGGDDVGTSKFAGNIDEVAMWKEVLSDNQITQLYRRGVNRLKFQIRGCYDSSCSGAGWVGPDGTSASYFSELINNDAIDVSTLDPLGVVSTGHPLFTFADYLEAGFNKLQTQYIQYRAIFQTDDLSYSPELQSVEIKK